MSWRGNRPVPTGVQAGREIGARSGWGAYCRGAGGIRNTSQSLEVAQGEEKGASKVDKCCQNEIELETSVQKVYFNRIIVKFIYFDQYHQTTSFLVLDKRQGHNTKVESISIKVVHGPLILNIYSLAALFLPKV